MENLWYRPRWRCWWSTSLQHLRNSLKNWLPDSTHYDLHRWPPDDLAKFPELDCLMVMGQELSPIQWDAVSNSYPSTLFVVFYDFYSPVPSLPRGNLWNIPWRPEQGIAHPRLVRLLQELGAGITLMKPGEELEETSENSPFAQWMAEQVSRLAGLDHTVVLAEFSSRPFVSVILARTLMETCAVHGRPWKLEGPYQIIEKMPPRWTQWLTPGKQHNRKILILYGDEANLKNAYDLDRPKGTVWCWMPRPSQLLHTGTDLLYLLPRGFTQPWVLTRWAWEKFLIGAGSDDMGKLLQRWERVTRIASHASTILTSLRMQLMASGFQPADSPEPMADIVTSLMHHFIREGCSGSIMAQMTSLFEKVMLEEITSSVATLQEALKLSGLSRATLLKKLGKYGIPNPWHQSHPDESNAQPPLIPKPEN